MTKEELINQRATTCRHGGHCEWVACDKCNHYEPKPETITNSTSGYLEVVLPECDDCISRQDALNCVTFHEFRYRMVEDIKALPTVTPKEKIGHWIKYSIPRCGEQHYQCTSCGYYINFGQWGEVYTKQFKYCPSCSARMIEPQEGEADGK